MGERIGFWLYQLCWNRGVCLCMGSVGVGGVEVSAQFSQRFARPL